MLKKKSLGQVGDQRREKRSEAENEGRGEGRTLN
jgi:hypothetical protein